MCISYRGEKLSRPCKVTTCPENPEVFVNLIASCQGSVRELTTSEDVVRETCLLLTSSLGLHECLVDCCRTCIACFKDFCCL